MSQGMRTDLRPLCSRHNHVMTYEPSGLQWRDMTRPKGTVSARPYYRCTSSGCRVRYSSAQGYFTIAGAPEYPTCVQEPANVMKCPADDQKLYIREHTQGEKGRTWCCGVEGCAHSFVDLPGEWR